MPRVLLLEDDPDSLEMLSMILESAGIDVVGASASATALAALTSSTFDLVLADLLVDTSDITRSWGFIDELVKLASPTPLGLLTAWPIKRDQVEAHKLAFALAKPCGTEALLSRLASALQVPALTSTQQATLTEYFASIERADWDALVGLCTEDVTYLLPGDDPLFAHSIRGRDAFREFAIDTFSRFLDPRFTLRAMRALPRGAVVEYDGYWRTSDGLQHKLPGAVMFVFEGDRIAEIGVRVDVARMQSLLAAS